MRMYLALYEYNDWYNTMVGTMDIVVHSNYYDSLHSR